MNEYQKFIEFIESNDISTDFFTGDYFRSYSYAVYIVPYRGLADVMPVPDDVYVYGSLDYSSSSLEASPKGLRVNGWLDISSTKISVIPCGTFIERNLYCSHGEPNMNVLGHVLVNGYIGIGSGTDYILS